MFHVALHNLAAHHEDGKLIICSTQGKISYRRWGKALKACEVIARTNGNVQRPLRCDCGFLHLTTDDPDWGKGRYGTCCSAPRLAEIARALLSNSSATLPEVARAVLAGLGLKPQTRYWAVRKLEQQGLISRMDKDLILIRDRVGLTHLAVDGSHYWY